MLKKELVEDELVEIPNYWPGNCFGCSPKNQYGLQLKVYLSDEGCFSLTTVSENYVGFEGIVHGGIIATLLDEIAAWTLIVHIQKLCMTQEAKIRYYRPVRINTPIVIEGKIIEVGECDVKTMAYIKDMDGNILTECESYWKIPDLKTLAKLTGKNDAQIEELYDSFIKPVELFKKERIKSD